MSPKPSLRSGRHALRAVVDTNVVVSGLIAPDGAPGLVLEAIRRRELELIVSWHLVHEIAAVLRRPSIRRYGITDEHVDRIVRTLGPWLPDVEMAVDIRDPGDAPVVAAAMVGDADAIITGDRDFLDDEALRCWLEDRGVLVMTPRELLESLP